MSKVKTTIFLVLLLALVNIATSTKLRAQTQLQIDITIRKLSFDGDAKTRCDMACGANSFVWIEKFSHKDNKTICVCTVNAEAFIFNDAQAKKECPHWCNKLGGFKWNGVFFPVKYGKKGYCGCI